VPQQPRYGEWDAAASHTEAGYGTYGYPEGSQYGSEAYGQPYHADQGQPGAYQADQGQADAYPADPYQAAAYPAGSYQAGPPQPGGYPADPYQQGQYDPYAYDGTASPGTYDQAYPQGYDPEQSPDPHGTGSERPDGSQQ
jgi:hypothetical protein